MMILGVATCLAAFIGPVQEPKDKKATETLTLDVVAVPAEKSNKRYLLDARNVRQNCDACHSPTPSVSALVCPQGHGALNVFEYVADGKYKEAAIQYQPYVTTSLTCAPSPAEKLGVTLRPVSAGLRTHLKLAEDRGVLVEDIAKESVLADADVKKYDVLVAVDDAPAKEPDKVVDLILERVAADKELTLKVVREGAPRTSTIRLEPTLVARLKDTPGQGAPCHRVGVSVAAVDDTLRRHLKIPNGEGAVVTTVEADSAAAEAKIKQHDILLRWKGQPIANSEGLVGIIQKNGAKPAKVTLFRDGKKTEATLTPKAVSPPTDLIQLQGEFLNRAAFQPADLSTNLVGKFYVSTVNANLTSGSVESEIAAALDQTKALQQALERLQARVAAKKETEKPKKK